MNETLLFLIYFRISGTHGELRWNGESTGPLIHYDFRTQKENHIPVKLTAPKARTSGKPLCIIHTFFLGINNK